MVIFKPAQLRKMKLASSENFRWYALVAGLAAVLMLLAALQYSSVKAVSTATTEQMRASLRGSLMDVRLGLQVELRPLCRDLQSGRSNPSNLHEDNLHEYAVRFERWRSVAVHPTLVEAVYVWQQNNESSQQLFKLNAGRTTFEPSAWPGELAELKEHLIEANRPPNFSDPNNPDPPPDSNSEPSRRGPSPPFRDERGAGPPRGDVRPSSWMIDENIPALVSPVPNRPFQKSKFDRPMPPSWLIVVLDRNVLGQHILPELIQRYFGKDEQSSYEVAVIDRNGRAPDLYTSGVKSKNTGHLMPDEALNLFGRPAPSSASSESSFGGTFAPPPNPAPESANLEADASPGEFHYGFNNQGPPSNIEPIRYYGAGQAWEIVAKHRQGSVEAAVAALSRRNLMFNFAVLLVLTMTMATIITAAARARRFGRLQMDFVTNVSHELRTPLTGIVSAAQNIADGLIDDKQRVSLYGKAIVREAHQLSELVEQILQFSAVQKEGDRYHLQPVDIAEVLQFSLQNISTLIQSAGVTVEQEIQPGLPLVSADFKALSVCLQNLIGNAIKYGGDKHWLGVSAWMEKHSNRANEVCISVSDRGIGIPRDELDRIFEPFYRTAEVTEAQIHGTGLGLPLAKRIAEAMGGSLTVSSEPGQGSTFTVHLSAK
jgi:signal transduction histidine kinase